MTPQEIAAGVAADIRQYGHARTLSETYGTQKCCVAVNPTVVGALDSYRFKEVEGYRRALASATGTDSGSGIIRWSDSTPTADVLAVLDQLAAS